MGETITRTLEATLVPPTAHKERKLKRLLRTYRDALSDAFEMGCTTMSAVNDVVTPYDLPYQAKDALKRYVPTLRPTYQASNISGQHPVRLVNRAAVFDHDPARKRSFCWQVPQPGRGTNFWIPIRINPDQQDRWQALLAGEAKPGELRLQQMRIGWLLTVTVEVMVATRACDLPQDNRTPIGFDIGETALVTGCARGPDGPSKPRIWSGARVKQLRKEMYTTLQRLQERNAAEWRIDEHFDHYQNALIDEIEQTSRQAVNYARQFEEPLVVMEDLSGIRRNVDYDPFMNRRLHSWSFARLQSRIEDKASEASIPVTYVRTEYTSKICHSCGLLGTRPSQGTFRCTNEGCHVTEFQADINAAANIAGRADPWGESVPWKPGRDDSPRDGSPRDRATGHVEGELSS